MHWSLVLTIALLVSGNSVACEESPINLHTSTGNIEGTLTVPEMGAGWPVMLIVPGSGPTDRDGNAPVAAGRNDSLRLLARALANVGIASVRYDKRGVGRSAAAAKSESDLRFEDYVQDAGSWVSKLSEDRRFAKVGIIGHSEGASIALFVASRTPLAAYVSIAGPAHRASDTIRRQLAGKLPSDLAYSSETIIKSLELGHTTEDVPAELNALFRPSVQPYLISWFKVNPVREIGRLSMPCLLIQGDTDTQISVAEAQELGASQPKCRINIIHGMNHVLKNVPDDQVQQVRSYGDPSVPLAPALVESLISFLRQI